MFEEQGVVTTPFYGGYGLVAEDRIPKPAFNAFAMLHKLGDIRLPAGDGPVLATRRKDGSVVLALWNYAPPLSTKTTYVAGPPKGETRHFTIDVANLPANAHATLWRLDSSHGNVIPTFDAMGRPAYPSSRQIEELQHAGAMAAPESPDVHAGHLDIDVPPQGLAVIELH